MVPRWGPFGQVKVLPSSGVAPYCDDTIKALEVKHPHKQPPSMASITFFEPPLVVEIDSVFDCIKSFLKDLLKVITSVVNLWLAGRCSPILAKFVASAPLTPLFKPDNEIRPIAVGKIWRRLVSKLAMKGVGKEMSKQQDCIWRHPLGPLLFALVLHSLVHKIKDSCKLLLHAWYLDDETVIGYSEEVASVLDIIKASGPEAIIDVEAFLGVLLVESIFSRWVAMRIGGLGFILAKSGFSYALWPEVPIFRRVGISAKKKALVNFLTDPLDGRSTLRPANVLVFGWLEGNMR
ncbi:hypothetical protein Tco_0482529 [Tanacetum coccineum]